MFFSDEPVAKKAVSTADDATTPNDDEQYTFKVPWDDVLTLPEDSIVEYVRFLLLTLVHSPQLRARI